MKEMLYGKTDLEKFVCFIKEFKENLSQYKRVVIRIDFPVVINMMIFSKLLIRRVLVIM